MRRKDREITDKNQIIEILDKSKIIHIALQDGEFPYVLPMHYGYELLDGKLVFYMHGALQGHKLDLIAANNKVGFELECDVELAPGGDIACKYGSYYASIIGKGIASIVDNADERIYGLKALMKNQTGRDFEINEDMAQAVAVIKVEVVDFSAKSRAK